MNENIFSLIPDAKRITSRTNPLIASLAKLQQTKHRREQKLYLAEGVKLSREAVGMKEVRYVILRSEDGTVEKELADIASACPRPTDVLVVPGSVFEKISTESAPQGIITVLAFQEDLHAPWTEDTAVRTSGKRILMADCVRDPGNLGTMIRTAAAFGFDRMILGDCADLYHPRTVRASMGALYRMHIDVCSSLQPAIRALRENGHRVLAAALQENSLTLGRDPLMHNDCIVIGNEGHGVSQEVLASVDAVVKIPMEPDAESLNAAGAAAVLMWEYYRAFP